MAGFACDGKIARRKTMTLGDYFKNLSNLFKSQKQLAQERGRRRRQAFRRAEMIMDNIGTRLKNLERDANAAWNNARELMKSGQKAAAQRNLMKYRSIQIMMVKLDQKLFAFQQCLMELEIAGTDEETAKILDLIAKIVNIDPEKVDDVLTVVDMKRAEQGEVDRLWQKEYQRHMEGAEGALEDFIPSMEELSKQLEDEAAQEIGEVESESTRGELAKKIEEGRIRVQKLLDEENEK